MIIQNSHRKISSIFFLPLISFLLAASGLCSLDPIELTSVKLDRQILGYGSDPRTIHYTHGFESDWKMIAQGKVIGSISQINTVNDPHLQFHFKYGLNSIHQYLEIQIFINPATPLSQNFYIVLDFMVARFPQSYEKGFLNMTEYQQHIMIKSNSSYDLLMLLNGFNNITLSGNITHHYIDESDMYVIHYMSDIGEENFMGWDKNKDYLTFTTVIMPSQHVIQEFHTNKAEYVVSNPVGYKYFYGLKSLEIDTFEGAFQQAESAVKFSVYNNPEPKKRYGVIFLPFEVNAQTQYIDRRVQLNFSSPSDTTSVIVGAIFGVTIVFLVIALVFCYRIRKMDQQQIQRLNQNSKMGESSFDMDKEKKHKNHIVISEESDNRGPAVDQSLKMNTVEQVEPEYEESLRGSSKIRTSGGQKSEREPPEAIIEQNQLDEDIEGINEDHSSEEQHEDQLLE